MSSHPDSGAAAASSPAEHPSQAQENVRADVQYEEKLTVAWWVWLIVVFVGAAGFVAVAPISIAVGVIVAVVLMVVIGLVLHWGRRASWSPTRTCAWAGRTSNGSTWARLVR